MKNTTKILLVLSVCTGMAFSVLADRGIGKRNKSKVDLNIASSFGFRNSISTNLKSGLRYTGSVLVKQQFSGSSLLNNSLVTYQKGNTVYIIPSKQVIAVPDIKQGYSGMKLIIRPH